MNIVELGLGEILIVVIENLLFFKKNYIEIISNLRKHKNDKRNTILLSKFTFCYYFIPFTLSFIICSPIEVLQFCHGLFLLAVSKGYFNLIHYHPQFRYKRAKAVRDKVDICFCLFFSFKIHLNCALENSYSPFLWAGSSPDSRGALLVH